MNKALLALFSLTLSAHSSGNDLYLAIKERGPDLLCNSNKYTQCLKLTKEACQLQVKSIHNDCFASFDSTYKEIDTNMQRAESYAVCASMSQMISYPIANSIELRSCNERVGTDFSEMAEEFMKANKVDN